MDSLRHCLASSSKPQLVSTRKCSQYWLMAVSSLRRPLLRYSMTLASPCMMHSRCHGQSWPSKSNLERYQVTLQAGATLCRKGRPGKRTIFEISADNFEGKFAVDMPMRPGPAVRAAGMAGLGASPEALLNGGFDAAGPSATF